MPRPALSPNGTNRDVNRRGPTPVFWPVQATCEWLQRVDSCPYSKEAIGSNRSFNPQIHADDGLELLRPKAL